MRKVEHNLLTKRIRGVLVGAMLLEVSGAVLAASTTDSVNERLFERRVQPQEIVTTLQPAPVAGVPANAVGIPVNFDFASTALGADDQRNLEMIAAAMNDPQLISATFVIEGHTDTIGSNESNMRLSRGRAQVAIDYLVRLGVASGRLSLSAMGEIRPLPGVAGTDWRNRRVTVVREY